MTRMETMSEALRRMAKGGYEDQFRAENGRLVARDAGKEYPPESLAVDEIARFEGMSNPADQSVVFALRSPEDGVRGTYVVAFGSDMPPADAKIVRRLPE